jgi:hypothetical protein
LEHFILVVSRCCPCLRGPRFFSLKWSCFGFCSSFDHLFEFSSHFFYFSLFSELVTCVCGQCTHQGGDWGPKRPRTGGWSLLAMMSDWQCGVDWLLAEYCRCMLQLDLRCVGEERARKVYALRGLWGLERQVGSAQGTRWPVGSSAGRMVARKARQSHGKEPVQGSGSRTESACAVCGGSPQNRRVTWLSHKTKTGGSAGRDGIRVCWEASIPADTWRDRRACVGRTQTMAKAWPCDEDECYMTYLPLGGLYHNSSARGTLVICPT